MLIECELSGKIQSISSQFLDRDVRLCKVIGKHIKVTGLEPSFWIKFQPRWYCLWIMLIFLSCSIYPTSSPWRGLSITVNGFLYLSHWLKCQRITKKNQLCVPCQTDICSLFQFLSLTLFLKSNVLLLPRRNRKAHVQCLFK